MLLPNRHDPGNEYRYGFQGQEKDDEIKGEGNSVNYKYRMHDPRVGRFFAVDPLTAKYPHYIPYSFSGNRVIDAIELEGLEELILIYNHKTDGSTTLQVHQAYNNFKQKKSLWFYGAAESNLNKWTSGRGSYLLGMTSDQKLWSGPTYGVLTIHSYQNLDESKISYDSQNIGIVDEHQSKIDKTIFSGAKDVIIGGVSIAGSILTEIGSLGYATALAYAGFIYGEDAIVGGIKKIFNPEDYLNDEEAKPIKYLIGEFLGENGKTVYDTINIASGAKGMTTGNTSLSKIVGAYSTIEGAEAMIKDKK